MIVGMAYVSPRRVLREAPMKVRVQFCGLVVSGIWIASVTLSARGEDIQPSNFVTYWPMGVAMVTWAFSAGAVWAQFNALKNRIESLEGVTVKKDVLAETMNALRMEIRGLRDLLERDHTWRDSHHGGQE